MTVSPTARLEREADRLGFKIVAYIATHYHWDHIGDKAKGVLGLKYFVDREDYPGATEPGVLAYVHEAELEAAGDKCDVSRRERMRPVRNNTELWVGIAVGETAILLHHPLPLVGVSIYQ